MPYYYLVLFILLVSSGLACDSKDKKPDPRQEYYKVDKEKPAN